MDYINQFRNKSEEERAMDSSKPLPGYHISRFFVRNYLSCIFTIYGLFVSETILALCLIIGTGVIIDLLRKKIRTGT